MSEDNTVNRRSVLKGLGTAGATAATAGYVKASSSDYDTAHVVEAGVRYKTDTVANYNRAYLEGHRIYNTSPGKVTVQRPVSKQVHDAFRQGEIVVRGRGLTSTPTTLTESDQMGIVTDLVTRKRPNDLIILSKPYSPPPVEVVANQDGTPSILINGRKKVLSRGENEFKLPEEDVVAETVRWEDPPEIEGVPERKLGKIKDIEPKDIRVKPIVEVRYRGEVEVDVET